MIKTKTIIGMALVLGFATYESNAQSSDYNPIKVGATFLNIAPDARAAGYGDIGVASSADNSSQFWNPAKYTFAEGNIGVSYSYTPWLSKLSKNINMHGVAGFLKKDRQAFSASLRYFDAGTIPNVDDNGTYQGDFKPNEFSVDFGYSRLLTERLSTSVSLRFIQSDLTGGLNQEVTGLKVARSFAADIALYWQKPIAIGANGSEVAWGAAITNIGSKLSYNNISSELFIPTKLAVGGRYTYNVSERSKFSALVEASKLLVPTPDLKDGRDRNADKNVISAIFTSWGDAPNGFSEELKEVRYNFGLEYGYLNRMFLRGGYSHESELKGNNTFYSLGASFKYLPFDVGMSYLIPYSGSSNMNPLKNTFRISVSMVLR